MCITHILVKSLQMNFGESFKNYRKYAKLTQKQVAEKLGVYQSNVSDWENNHSRPEYENLIELAKLYEVTIEELLGVDYQFRK